MILEGFTYKIEKLNGVYVKINNKNTNFEYKDQKGFIRFYDG